MMALITISVSLDNVFCAISAAAFSLVGPWALFIESVTWEKCKFNFKISLTALFTYLKFILLQCFQ